jgi:hypothetical protein
MNEDRISRPRKSGEMSDMVHRIKHFQGNAPMPSGCICSPMDFAALGHMTTCPLYQERNNDG